MSENRPDLLYLSGDDVEHLLPPLKEQFDLIRDTFSALARKDAQAPPASPLHPRPTGFADAMPAYLPSLDLTSVKWVAGDERNGEKDLPYLSGLMILNDGDGAFPLAVMDAAAITAARTAAVSGVSIDGLAPSGWSRVGIIGFGAQAVAHVRMLRELNPSVSVKAVRRRTTNGTEDGVELVATAAEAVDGADIVITAIPLSGRLDPPLDRARLGGSVLVMPLDDDASVAADLVADADLFVVDDPDRYARDQAHGLFGGWPEPDSSVAKTLGASASGPGVTVCMNQGIGLMDAPLAEAVRRAALEKGVGQLLKR